MDVWKQLAISAIAVIAWAAVIAGLIVDYPQLKERLPEKLRKHPRFTWIAAGCFGMAITLHFIWSRPAALPLAQINPVAEAASDEKTTKEPASEPDSEPAGDEKKEESPALVPNHQAELMAKEFLTVLAAINGKQLAAHEEKFYWDYLRATMPAKIATICGEDECAQFEELLKRLKSKSESLQLHYRGVEPFVTRTRFINPQTPSAGPVIALTQNEPTNKDSPNKDEPQVVVAAKPPIDEKTQKIEIPPKADQKPEPENLTPKASENTTLKEYLARKGWVQCRKCGTVYTRTFEFFAKHDEMKCANKKCKFNMHFHGFHQEIADEVQRLRQEYR